VERTNRAIITIILDKEGRFRRSKERFIRESWDVKGENITKKIRRWKENIVTLKIDQEGVRREIEIKRRKEN
jgi:hypothetical protein